MRGLSTDEYATLTLKFGQVPLEMYERLLCRGLVREGSAALVDGVVHQFFHPTAEGWLAVRIHRVRHGIIA